MSDRWWCLSCKKIVSDVTEYSSAYGYRHNGCGKWAADYISPLLIDTLKAEGAAEERQACIDAIDECDTYGVDSRPLNKAKAIIRARSKEVDHG